MRGKKKGQTFVEYIALITIVIGVFVGMSVYFKRGISGRWKAAVDDLGDQYDPRLGNSSLRHVLVANALTRIFIIETVDGRQTFRQDTANSVERRKGSVVVGGIF